MKSVKSNAFLFCITAVLLISSCGKKEDSQQGQQNQPPRLAVMKVGESDVNLETSIPASLEGENDIEIRPQVSGFLTKVHVQDGQRVKKGEVLFTIDQVQLQAAVDQAEAAVAVAQANVNTAQTSVANNKILLDKNIIRQSAYQTSVDGLNSAKAQLNQAQAALTSARKNLSYSTVTAPVEKGQVLGEIRATLNGEEIARCSLIAAESVDRIGALAYFRRLLKEYMVL